MNDSDLVCILLKRNIKLAKLLNDVRERLDTYYNLRHNTPDDQVGEELKRAFYRCIVVAIDEMDNNVNVSEAFEEDDGD